MFMATMIYGMLQEEKERNLRMQNACKNKLEQLPKGCILTKERNGKKYFYLHRRVGKEFVTEYLGKDEVKIEALKRQIAERKMQKATLRRLKVECKQISKIVKG